MIPITKSDPKNADAWNVQGKLLMDKKEYRPAAEALTRSLELQSNVMVAYALATAYLSLHENDKAAAIFQRLSDATGDRASMHIMSGRAYQNAGMMDDAIREFNRAAQLDAKGSRAHYFLGLLYMSAERVGGHSRRPASSSRKRSSSIPRISSATSFSATSTTPTSSTTTPTAT